MPIRADDPRPVHEQVAADLRDRITSGEYRGGQRLPSTRELMSSYGVANGTAQRAIGVLRDEGLVDVTAGRGAFVRQPGTAERADVRGSVAEALDEASRMLEEVNQMLSSSDAGQQLQGVAFDDVRATLRETDELLSRAEAGASSSEPEVAPPPDQGPGPAV